jgi:hypothetical protein
LTLTFAEGIAQFKVADCGHSLAPTDDRRQDRRGAAASEARELTTPTR